MRIKRPDTMAKYCIIILHNMNFMCGMIYHTFMNNKILYTPKVDKI